MLPLTLAFYEGSKTLQDCLREDKDLVHGAHALIQRLLALETFDPRISRTVYMKYAMTWSQRWKTLENSYFRQFST